MTNGPLRPHDLAATGTEHHHSAGSPGIMGLPKRQVRRERKGVKNPVVPLRGTQFDDALTCNFQILQIVFGVKNGRWLSTAPSREGHENRAKLGLELLLHSVAPSYQRTQNGSRPSRKHFRVGDHDELSKPLRLLRSG